MAEAWKGRGCGGAEGLGHCGVVEILKGWGCGAVEEWKGWGCGGLWKIEGLGYAVGL